jgi:hypothetical protein
MRDAVLQYAHVMNLDSSVVVSGALQLGQVTAMAAEPVASRTPTTGRSVRYSLAIVARRAGVIACARGGSA